MPEGRSALQGVRKPGRFGAPVADGPWVTVREVRGLTIVEVAGWPDTFPGVVSALPAAIRCPVSDRFGVASASGDTAVFWTGPERLWVVTPDRAVGERLERAFDDDRAVCVDLTHSRTILRIAGPKTRALLAKGLPIDLHPREFPAGGVALGAGSSVRRGQRGRRPGPARRPESGHGRRTASRRSARSARRQSQGRRRNRPRGRRKPLARPGPASAARGRIPARA